MNTERWWSASAWTSSSRARAAERRGERVDRGPVPPLGEVRHGFEREHGATLRAGEGVLRRAGARVRRVVRGRGRFTERERPGWDEELAELRGASSARCRRRGRSTSPAAPAFLTRHLRGPIVGLDQSDADARDRAASRRRRRSSCRATRSSCRSPTARSSACSRRTSTGISTRTSGRASSPRRGGSRAELVDRRLGAPRGRRARGGMQERILNDGSRWRSRSGTSRREQLAEELGGGETLHAGRWFVVVALACADVDAPRGAALVPLARLAPARQPRAAAPAPSRVPARVAARSSHGRPRASARTSSARRPASSRARSSGPGAAAPGRRSAAGSSSTRTRSTTTFYCAAVTRCYPGRPPSGRGDRTPTPREQELCAFWREWELRLLRPRLIVTVGGLAARRLLGATSLALRRRAVRARRRDGRPAPPPVRRERAG